VIDSDLIEQLQIAQWTVQFSGKHRLKVDGLFTVIVKPDTDRVWRYDFERPDLMNSVLHKHLFQRFDGRGFASLLQSLPVGRQFSLVQLRPSFHQTPLPAWQQHVILSP
jgi:hypothetical protein